MFNDALLFVGDIIQKDRERLRALSVTENFEPDATVEETIDIVC